jgi:hypothetical protein
MKREATTLPGGLCKRCATAQGRAIADLAGCMLRGVVPESRPTSRRRDAFRRGRRATATAEYCVDRNRGDARACDADESTLRQPAHAILHRSLRQSYALRDVLQRHLHVCTAYAVCEPPQVQIDNERRRLTVVADDGEATAREMKAQGVEFMQDPQKADWGTAAVFKDQDGNIFALSTP